MATLRVILAAMTITLWSAAAYADRDQRMDQLLEALRVADTVAIMRAEGLVYGDELADQMLPEADFASWRRNVERIYDPAKMQMLVEAGLAAELEGVDVAPLATFFASELGSKIIELELSAREAFIEPEIEEAAKDYYEQMASAGVAIIGQIDTLVADSDLVELNVMGILNSHLMLYRGLADGGAYELSEEDILIDVWSQEDTVRADSREWIGAYFLTAYQPLEPDEIDVYTEFWRTDEGRELNRALFAVFDRMYEELSYLLGQAVAQHMRSQKL